MKIPLYWLRVRETAEINGRTYPIMAWGWSDRSAEEAGHVARERLPRIREAIARGSKSRAYDYFANPIREHRIEARENQGREFAVVTRNGYGALVLNAARVMFIDIDVPPGFRFLFWGKSTARKKEEALERVEGFVRGRGLPARIYETRGGLRLAVVDGFYEPDGDEAKEIMERLGADPLYLRLCRAQKCFRARLTPKPWRIGQERPPFRFPEDPDASPYREWLQLYERARSGYRACRLVREVGKPRWDSEIEEVLRLHDERCGVGGEGELA